MYRPYLPEQDFPLPSSSREWLPEGHLAYFVSDLSDQLDLSQIEWHYDREENFANEYRHIDELGVHLEEFIDHYYNRLGPHSALQYKAPAEFKAAFAPQTAPTMSYPRHWEFYRSWKWRGRPRKESGEPVSADSPVHRIDERQVGYSLTGWSLPEPVCASPTATESEAQPTK